uniref:Uncharacterized protein n=1 Tax=Amphimedon queenslandica TaxID=400682 RepID=A0A1X7SWZ0_AMPQE
MDLAALEEAVVARAVETLTLRPRGRPRRPAPELEAVAEMGGREPLADITPRPRRDLRELIVKKKRERVRARC